MTTVGVSGHQNIPFAALDFIEKGIRDVIRRYGNELIGVSSLAAGADQLFAKTILSVGGRLHVVIPCRRYESTFSDQSDLNCFFDLRQKANIIETLDHAAPSEDAFLDAGRRVVDLSDQLVAIWDGKGVKGKGGTADIVHYAQERGMKVFVVWPPGVSR